MAVEFGWETIKVSLHDGVRAFGGLVGLDGWKGAEDMGGVLKEDTCHDKDGAKIGVIADDNFRLLFAIHQAKRGENHRQAKSDETEATDGGNNIETEEIGVLFLDFSKEDVELLLLIS